jgi:hypothetical protein
MFVRRPRSTRPSLVDQLGRVVRRVTYRTLAGRGPLQYVPGGVSVLPSQYCGVTHGRPALKEEDLLSGAVAVGKSADCLRRLVFEAGEELVQACNAKCF